MNIIKAFDTMHIAALCLVDIKNVLDETFKSIEDKIIYDTPLKRRFKALQKQVNELTKDIKNTNKTMNLIKALNEIKKLVSVIYETKQILTPLIDYITNEDLKNKILKIFEEIKEITE